MVYKKYIYFYDIYIYSNNKLDDSNKKIGIGLKIGIR
jgi:hypothetical protein